MGCGKTTHGRKLARLLDYTFIDLDEKIVAKTGSSIQNLFNDLGETGFRDLETTVLKEICSGSAMQVISLGGGTPCYNHNLDFIKAKGLLIYIKMEPVALYSRLKNARVKRPLLKGKTDQELLDYITQLLEKREPYYAAAHFWINGINLNDKVLKDCIENFRE